MNLNSLKMSRSELDLLEIAMAGRHNILICGKKKGSWFEAIHLLHPPLSDDQKLSVERIYSQIGIRQLTTPIRIPSWTATLEGICGGGRKLGPGEISLAHNGVLFLDDAAEFRTTVLQLLRVPIENKSITLSRAGRSTVFPANFQLVMKAKPCPCGNYGASDKVCLCSSESVKSYWRKFGSPLIDKVEVKILIDEKEHTCSDYTLEQFESEIATARERQLKRGKLNCDITVQDAVDIIANFTEEMKEYLSKVSSTNLNTTNIVKVAQTIADLNNKDTIDLEMLRIAHDVVNPAFVPWKDL